MVAFLSSQPLPKPKPDDAHVQLWLINSAGGAPWSLTQFERGIEQIAWLDDDTILFSAAEDASLYERETKEHKDDSDVVDDTSHTAPVRIFKFSIKDQKVTRLTDNADWILNFEISHDKKQLVAVARRELSYAWDQKIPPVTYLVNIATGERTEIFTGERISPDDFEWARDSSGFYVVAPFSDDPKFFTASVERIYFYDLAAAKAVSVNLDWDRGFARSLQTTSDGFIALLMDGVYTKPVRFIRHGGTWSRKALVSDDAKHYFSFALGDDGKTLVYEYSTASAPTQFFRAHLDGVKISSPLQITDLNPNFKTKTIAKSEVLHWKGANDDDVEGILFYPDDYKRGKSYPLITATHGGEDELSRQHRLRSEVGRIHLLRQILRSRNSGHRTRGGWPGRSRAGRSGPYRRHGLVQRFHPHHSAHHHESRSLQSGFRRGGRRGMAQRLGQRRFR
jgi:dipeptidyl aminopeptidase/acylaminoacyl peptidase